MAESRSSSDTTETTSETARYRLSLRPLHSSVSAEGTSLPDDARLGPPSSAETTTNPAGQTVPGVAPFPAWLRRLGYYGLALLLLATGVAVRAVLTRLVGPGLPTYLTFYPFVMLAALIGGWGPGVLATVAAMVVADSWLLLPQGLFKIESEVDLVGLVFFCIVGIFMSIVAELYRRMRGHLEELVLLRTAALRQVNAQLQTQARELHTRSQELAELAGSLEREKHILQGAMDGARNSHLVFLDRDFNFVRVNEAYARTCGYTPEQMIGRNHFALYPSAENEAIFARARATGVPVEFHDKPFIFPDQPERGTTYWDWTLTPIKNDAGQVEGLVFSLFETTERERAEQALRESKEALAKAHALVDTLLAQAFIGFALLDRDLRFVLINERLAEMNGLPVEAHLGQRIHDIVPGLVSTAEKVVDRILATGRPVKNHEFSGETASAPGVQRCWTESWYPMRDSAGAISGFGVVVEEITERKLAEQAVRESEARFRILTTNLSAGVALIDEDGKFALYNPAFLTMFGLAEHNSIRNVNDQNWGEWQVFEEDGTLLHVDDHPVRKTASTGQAVKNKLVGVRLPSGGALRWMLVSAEPVPRADGRRAIICTYHDVTERKRAGDALRELNATLESKVAERTEELEHRARQLQKLTLELAEAEERERERVAQILHDDLQQILAAAKFHLSRVGSGTRGPEQTREIVRQVDRMLNDAIEKSRSLSHELSPAVLRRGDLAETFKWLAEQMQAKHGLMVRVEASGTAKARSDAVKTLLYRSAREMLFNVVKHAQVREARVRVRRRGPYLCLSVSDRGRGFDPREIKKTAGFGLWNIRERVALLGGRMKTRTVKGRGTTFRIVVPDTEPSGTGVAMEWQTTHE